MMNDDSLVPFNNYEHQEIKLALSNVEKVMTEQAYEITKLQDRIDILETENNDFKMKLSSLAETIKTVAEKVVTNVIDSVMNKINEQQKLNESKTTSLLDGIQIQMNNLR